MSRLLQIFEYLMCVKIRKSLPVPSNPFSLLLCSHSASELPISINQRPVSRSRDHSRPNRCQGMLTVESHDGNVSLLLAADGRADGNSLLTSLFIDGSAVTSLMAYLSQKLKLCQFL